MITKRNIIFSQKNPTKHRARARTEQNVALPGCVSALLASDFGAQKRSTSAAAIMNSSIDASSLYALRSVVFPEKTEPNWSVLDTYSSHTSSSPPHLFSPSSANGTDSVGSHLSLGNNQQSGIAVDAEDVAQKLRLGQVRRGAEWLWRCGANHLKPHL